MILYIGGLVMELKEAAQVPLTKQVNNIVSLSTRQASYTNTISLPRTATNVRNFRSLGLVGSKSRVPYEKLRCDYLDDQTGDWVIYNGWANVVETTTDFKVSIYEGVIDFYKAIENKTLTEIGVSGLNHVKNITTVVESWDDDKPYMYIVADYNGKNLTDTGALNIDYLVPAFRMSYVWDRIFEYAGFTYSGAIFQTEKFINWWATYPKPVPVNTPVVNEISEQDSGILENPVTYPTAGGGIFLGAVYSADLLPADFNTAEANNLSGFITIELTGAFRIKCSGVLSSGAVTNSTVVYSLRDSAGLLKLEGTLDASNDESVTVLAVSGDRLFLGAQLTGVNAPAEFGGYRPLEGTVRTTFDYIVGYDANFEEALIEFQAKKLVDEVVQHFALTMIPDRYSRNIEFLTLDEILQNEPIDWSSKFQNLSSEKYKIGSYAQRNRYRYRYNEENEEHNDGFININDKNLSDETTILASSFYSPEARKTAFLGQRWNVYRMWNREVKDDGIVEYKDLAGRYYLLRNESFTYETAINIASESLGTSTTATTIQRENYFRLDLQEVLFDNYQSITSILNDAKLSEINLYLTSSDVAGFDFKRLIYIEQLSSYFLVNKIPNFVSGKIAKVEVMEVDYYDEGDQIENPPEGSFIEITDTELSGCEVTITFNTDAPLPALIRVVAVRNTFGAPPTDSDIYEQTLTTDEPISITLPAPGFWQIRLYLSQDIYSLPVTIDNTGTCEVEPTPSCEPTGVLITNVNRFNANWPLPSGAGSLWKVDFELQGVSDPSTGVCNPYDILVILATNLGTQSASYSDVFLSPATVSFNLPLRPSTAAVKMYFTAPSGITYESETYFFP